MKRVYVEVGRNQPVHTFTDWRIPRDVELFLKENQASIVGEGYENYPLASNEMVTIDEQEYIHVASRKFFKLNSHSKLGGICELTLIQPLLYEENHDENA